MADKTYDILIDIQARVAAIDAAIAKVQQLESSTTGAIGNVARAGDAAAASIARITPLLSTIAAGLGIGIAGAFVSIIPAVLRLDEELRGIQSDNEKISRSLNDQVDKWRTLARTAKDANAVFDLQKEIVGTFDAAEKRIDDLNQKSRTFIQYTADLIASIYKQQTFSGPFESALADSRARALQDLSQHLDALHALTLVANDTSAAFERINTKPLSVGLDEINARVDKLRAQANALFQQTFLPRDATPEQLHAAAVAAAAFIAKSAELNLWVTGLARVENAARQVANALDAASRANLEKTLELTGQLDELAKKRSEDAAAAVRALYAGVTDPALKAKGLEEEKKAAALVTAEYQKQKDLTAEQARLEDNKTAAQQLILEGDEKHGNQLLLQNQIEQDALRISQQRRISYADAYAIAQNEVTTQQGLKDLKESQRGATEGELAAHRQITDLLREDSALLRSLQQQQRLITENPFLGPDEKQSALHANAIAQQQELATAIQQTQGALQQAYGAGAQEDITRLGERLTDLQTRFIEVGYTIQTTNFTGQFGAELVQWVNQVGTAAHNAAQIVTSTLNTALSSASQALTGLIFQTGNWRQTFAQAAQSIIQNIIQIVLQYTIGQAIMFAIRKAFGSQEERETNKRAAQAAIQWAPGAIAASIASYGAAAGAGLAAFLGAEVVGTAVAVGLSAGGSSYATGGYTGDGAPDEVAGIVHRGEYVIPAGVVDRLGVQNIRTFVNTPLFLEGGLVGAGSFDRSGDIRSELRKRDIKIIQVRDEFEAFNEYLQTNDAEVHIVRAVNKSMRT
jgi:hypothetical protein